MVAESAVAKYLNGGIERETTNMFYLEAARSETPVNFEHGNIPSRAYNANSVSASNAVRAIRMKSEFGDKPTTGIDDCFLYRFGKRSFGIIFNALVLVLFCWLYALIALAIKIDYPKGPALFKQTRAGKDSSTFLMIKFRSICVGAEKRLGELRELYEKSGPVLKIVGDPRSMHVGKWLRKLSLNELPQFVNTLVGNISIVVPCSTLFAEVELYDVCQRRRLLIKPSIMYYWQTRRNRDTITFDEWVDLDLHYIKKCRVWTDSELVIQAIDVVLTAQGS